MIRHSNLWAGVVVATLATAPVYAQTPDGQTMAAAAGHPEILAQASQEQALVDHARSTIEALKVDPNFSNFNSLLRQAKAVIVVPNLIKAGLIIGGEGGTGVLMARNAQGRWSAPAFYKIGAASIGLQIGAQSSEVVLIVMTNRALGKLLQDRVTLGGDVSVAAGQAGSSLAAQTTTNAGADIYAFARNKGLFGGLTLQGGWLTPNQQANRAYYGTGANAHDIVIDQRYENPGAEQLRGSLPS